MIYSSNTRSDPKAQSHMCGTSPRGSIMHMCKPAQAQALASEHDHFIYMESLHSKTLKYKNYEQGENKKQDKTLKNSKSH